MNQNQKILLPVSNLREAEVLLPLAHAISQATESKLLVLNLLIAPTTDRLSQEAENVSRSREALNKYLLDHNYELPEIQTIVRVAHELWEGIWEIVDQEQIKLLILGWQSTALPETALGDIEHIRLVNPPCDVVFVKPKHDFDPLVDWQTIAQILMPTRGGPSAVLSFRIAQALAEMSDTAKITLLHVTSSTPVAVEEKIFSEFGSELRRISRLKRSLVVIGDVHETILDEIKDHQAIVMGAPSSSNKSTWKSESLDYFIENSDINLIICKEANTIDTISSPEINPNSTYQDRPLTHVVDKWFAENTFHSREFKNLEDLIHRKEHNRLTISLGLPALNEEETVGSVISVLKRALMDDFPLLDEIVLIDSGSTDYTREIAEDMGIPVYIHEEILPQYGSYIGKGEALWKSLYVLKGDIIAWIDTDIKNIHPRFAYGVIGPLLTNEHILYVKGFYRRPLRKGNKMVAGGGGRVTELTARPFINLFYPELSGIIQPLSGEYAGRRSVLEKLPFFTGYGVETGLLLDLLDKYGLHTIAQSDLLERIHHNQPLRSLSKMSFTIIQVFMKRLQERHRIHLLNEAHLTMNLPSYYPNKYYLDTQDLCDFERPPMIEISEYQSKAKKRAINH